MGIFHEAKWIKPSKDYGEVSPIFKKAFSPLKPIKKATLYISAIGVYEAEINGKRVGDFVMAPGWTSYEKRLQYQEYDVTEMLEKENEMLITIGKGWCRGLLTWHPKRHYRFDDAAVILKLQLDLQDGRVETICSDESFLVSESKILYSSIYNGEVYDARSREQKWEKAAICNYSKDILIPQEGEMIKEIETLKPIALLKTPFSDNVIDFGQNLTGYVRFNPRGKEGEVIEYSHAEILDKDGEFYTDNLRGAKQKIIYICNGKDEKYNPHFSFQGFRYIRLDKWNGEIDLNDFEAVVVHSAIERTGFFECSNPKVNQLFKNIVWGQRGNFLDVPTDCPQRDERLGWTGDAQAFVRTASYNFDVETFFKKWLNDLACDQLQSGGVPAVIPDVLDESSASSAAWGDAAVICPWQIYLTYGDKAILQRQFDSMKKWVEYLRKQGDNEFLRNTGHHYGDWLGLDAPTGSYKGSTAEDLIGTAFFAYSTDLLIRAGKALGKDMAEYEKLYENVVSAFRKTFIKDGELTSNTQTAHALALYFNLCEDKTKTAKALADLVAENGNKLTTGFVGTPYLLHALSENGYEELAYSLLLQEEYPSWIFSVNQGATTIWEHWDGMNDKGELWSRNMNSFNHYAYGAVADWMYGVAAGINTDEACPGFKHIIFKPVTDDKLDFVNASIKTRHGQVASSWKKTSKAVEYTFEVPKGCTATAYVGGKEHSLAAGKHTITA